MGLDLSNEAHRANCRHKQAERRAQIDALPPEYFQPITESEQDILRLSVSEISSKARSGLLDKHDILLAYGKKAIQAQNKTNCLSEVMIADALARLDSHESNAHVDENSSTRPLEGVVISLKDSEPVAGYDTTCSFSALVGKPAAEDGPIARVLRSAGAIIHAKTTLPILIHTCETQSDLFGRTSNPYNSAYSPGGSSGGGGALAAYSGTGIEIGTDIAGSLRIPAHFCGLYVIKGSIGRFITPGTVPGGVNLYEGLESCPLIAGPITRTLDDLEEAWKAVLGMEPWRVDPGCIPMPWKEVKLGKKVRWGVIWDDGIVPPSPACKRALELVVDALSSIEGHEVVDFVAPKSSIAQAIGVQLLFQDNATKLTRYLCKGEYVDPAIRQVLTTLKLPRFAKRLLAYYARHYQNDELSASILEGTHASSASEIWEAVIKRDAYRAEWARRWEEEELDFVLTVPTAMPALREGAMSKATVMMASYCFLFNILDYSAGVLPVTNVSSTKDQLPSNFMTDTYPKLNSVARGCYDTYDPVSMNGLPLGVQVVGRRLEEEKVIAGMRMIEEALKKAGTVFVPKTF